jgi:hypothetical protein
MLENAPETMPYLMPMTAGVAPAFAARYPEASIIFDNLHMMHDVISDILASPDVPRNRKRAEILKAAAMFRDDTSYAIPVDEWRMMGEMMGVHNMGGVASGFIPELPTPTVPRGMSMAGMDHSQMDHGQMQRDQTQGHEGHMMPGAQPAAGHEGHRMQGMDGMNMEMHRSMEFIVRLLSDPQIEAKIHADPRLHQLWADPEVQRHLQMMRQMHGTPAAEHEDHGAQAAPQRSREPQPQQPRGQPHRH